MLRGMLLTAAGSARLRSLVETVPATRSVVHRFVPGADTADAVRATRALASDDLRVTIDHLGEDTTSTDAAANTVRAYQVLLSALAEQDLARGADVSVKLTAVGASLPEHGGKIALANAQAICEAAAEVGATVTLDAEDHTRTDTTLEALRELRADFPWVGAVVQAYLRRTEADCRDLATAGSRVRLCKGAYAEPESVAYPDKSDVDASYARCLGVLMRGAGYPMIASHDPKMIALGQRLAQETGRGVDSHEFQMLYGIRPDEQRRIAATGRTMRVYVPYGTEWYGYFVRRLAERPANLTFFLRGLATKG